MKQVTQEFKIEPLTSLRLHPRNPRRGSIAAIGESIERNGWYGAVVAQRSTGYILAGNHRYRAAKKQGATEIPVCWIDVDDSTALRILLADNRTSDVATNNDRLLTDLLEEILKSNESLAGTGFDDRTLDDLLRELSEETAEPAPALAEDQTDRIVERWEVVVTCKDEEDQRALLEQLTAEGRRCRALVS